MATLKDLDRALRLMPGSVERRIAPALFAAGNRIQVAAQTSITDGAVSGAGHVASLPGEAPNNDTGVLANNIETVAVNPLKVEITSKARYAARLEFGDSKIAARPYMAPAANRERQAATALVRKAMAKAVRETLRAM